MGWLRDWDSNFAEGGDVSGSVDRCMSVGAQTAILCCRSSSQIWNTEKVDDSSCREVRWHQGFAELITVGKNRCIPMIDPADAVAAI